MIGFIIITIPSVIVILLLMGAGYNLQNQNKEIQSYLNAQKAYIEVNRQIKLNQFIKLRKMRKDLHEAYLNWAEDKTPVESPKSSRLKREIDKINKLVRENPDILSNILKSSFRENTDATS